jgi:hypothetical protein
MAASLPHPVKATVEAREERWRERVKCPPAFRHIIKTAQVHKVVCIRLTREQADKAGMSSVGGDRLLRFSMFGLLRSKQKFRYGL